MLLQHSEILYYTIAETEMSS